MADPHRLKHSARLAKQRGGFWTLDTGADDRYGPADRLPWPGDAWSESHTGLGRLVLEVMLVDARGRVEQPIVAPEQRVQMSFIDMSKSRVIWCRPHGCGPRSSGKRGGVSKGKCSLLAWRNWARGAEALILPRNLR
jgi:hypothetical protein